MSVVSIVHTKGGVGKTTTAIYLAAAAHAAGKTVEVIDADPQGSATEWAADARSAGIALPFPVRAATDRLRPATGVELTLIDTPPGLARVIQPAITAADLVIIPTSPSPLDMRRAWPTLEVTAARPTVVLLTAVALGTNLVAAATQAFQDEGVPVFASSIPRREAIKQAYGTAPRWPLYGYDDVLKEVLEVLA